MSIVRLLAFETLGCGCVAGHYREAGSARAVSYIEEKSPTCTTASHRRNHVVSSPSTRSSRAGQQAGSAASAWQTT
jgi:hypothetical protein